MKKLIIIAVIIALCLLLYFLPLYTRSSLALSSESFVYSKAISQIYTCDGENISPHLAWHTADTAVKSYILIVDDPDAQAVVGKTFVHWVVVMPAHIQSLSEGISSAQESKLHTLDPQAQEMINDSGKTSYYGPCPPAPAVHTYRFTLFAITSPLDVLRENTVFKKPCTAEMIQKEFSQTIIAQTCITGTYKR